MLELHNSSSSAQPGTYEESPPLRGQQTKSPAHSESVSQSPTNDTQTKQNKTKQKTFYFRDTKKQQTAK